MTLPRTAQVVSWAPLHGLPTHAQHILIHQVDDDSNGVKSRLNLRKAASRARLSGTIVGMCSTASVADYGVGEAQHEELRAAAVCVATVAGLATIGEASSFIERISRRMACGGIHLVIATNHRMTHEAMFETMALAVEAKVQTLYEFGLQSRVTGAPAGGFGDGLCGRHLRARPWSGQASKSVLELRSRA